MLVVTMVLALLSSACTDGTASTTTPESRPTTTDTPATTSTTTLEQTTISSTATPTTTTTFRHDPAYFTFDNSTECDSEAENADLHVVQAFFTAYNEQNLARLQELIETDEIWDPSAVSHTGQVLLTDVVSWAESGWEVDDRFELLRLVSYGPRAGSDVMLLRRNEGLEAIGIEAMVVGFKVPSSGCTIDRLVGHIDSTALANCAFYDVFQDVLQKELTQEWNIPAICTPTTPASASGPDRQGLEDALGTHDRTCVDVDVIVATEEPKMVGPEKDVPVFDIRSGEILAGNFASMVNQWSTEWPEGQAKIYWVPLDPETAMAGVLEVLVEPLDREAPATLQTFDTRASGGGATFWPSGTKFSEPGRYRLTARAAGHWACFELTV